MLNNYIIFLDLLGTKLQMEVEANNEKHAKKMAKEKLKIESIVKCKPGALQELINREKKEKSDAKIEVN